MTRRIIRKKGGDGDYRYNPKICLLIHVSEFRLCTWGLTTANFLNELFIWKFFCEKLQERCQLRHQWYAQLSKNDHQKVLYELFMDSPPDPFQDIRRSEKSVRVLKKIQRRIHQKEVAVAQSVGVKNTDQT